MTRALICHQAGPGVTVQDMGRTGLLAQGLSRGGAADRRALSEGAALLGQSDRLAALEMAGMGGVFEATEDIAVALTGAPMRAEIDGAAILWNAAHLLPKGAKLKIGAATAGTYGYLSVAGGIDTTPILGARSVHLTAGLGAALGQGARLPVGPAKTQRSGVRLAVAPRFDGGEIRVLRSLQTDFFPTETLERFESTVFSRDQRGNRMGVRMNADGAGFHVEGGLNVISEVIVAGDIQVTGDGAPYVLLAECQTTGGYPRIGTVIPSDLPRVAQAGPGAKLRFRFVGLDEALALHQRDLADVAALKSRVEPLVRDPARINNLLEYQLISGVTSGAELQEA